MEISLGIWTAQLQLVNVSVFFFFFRLVDAIVWLEWGGKGIFLQFSTHLLMKRWSDSYNLPNEKSSLIYISQNVLASTIFFCHFCIARFFFCVKNGSENRWRERTYSSIHLSLEPRKYIRSCKCSVVEPCMCAYRRQWVICVPTQTQTRFYCLFRLFFSFRSFAKVIYKRIN